jgi:hypothetical protein
LQLNSPKPKSQTQASLTQFHIYETEICKLNQNSNKYNTEYTQLIEPNHQNPNRNPKPQFDTNSTTKPNNIKHVSTTISSNFKTLTLTLAIQTESTKGKEARERSYTRCNGRNTRNRWGRRTSFCGVR